MTLSQVVILIALSILKSIYAADSFSLEDFKNVLYTEIHNEIEVVKQNKASRRRLRKRGKNDDHFQSDQDDVWNHVVDHGWSLAGISKIKDNNGYEETHSSNVPIKEDQSFPFMVCSQSPRIKFGYQRLQHLAQAIGIKTENIIPVFNDDLKTCFHVSLNVQNAQYLQTKTFKRIKYSIVPVLDLMKLPVNSLKEVTQDYWKITPPTQGRDSNDGDWERTIHVGLSPNTVNTFDDKSSHEAEIKSKASTVLRDIQSMGQEGSRQRRRQLKGERRSDDQSVIMPITDAFSLTSKKISSRRLQFLELGRAESLSNSLANGIESDHNCQTMFSSLNIIVHRNDFDIVLNPKNIAFEYDKSSAANTHCIVSLMIALSTHPSVITVEPDTPITPDDYQSQWISQSYHKDRPERKESRPFFDAGLTGKNQVISMSDSGLDVQHPYFSPVSSDRIYEVSIR